MDTRLRPSLSKDVSASFSSSPDQSKGQFVLLSCSVFYIIVVFCFRLNNWCLSCHVWLWLVPSSLRSRPVYEDATVRILASRSPFVALTTAFTFVATANAGVAGFHTKRGVVSVTPRTFYRSWFLYFSCLCSSVESDTRLGHFASRRLFTRSQQNYIVPHMM